MIISHRYRYLFVETPHTASTAIARELVANYAGEKILLKHSSYDEFARSATPDERKYFVFAGLRHPMDVTVSIYHRIAKDHNQRYSQPRPASRINPHYRSEIEQYQWIQGSGADFRAWFLNHAWLPYDDWMTFDRHHFDAVIRFERLQDDFAAIVRQLQIEPVGPLPVANATAFRDRDFAAYFTPETRRRAAYFFGPYMQLSGYEFPAQWGRVEIPRRAWLMLRLLRPFRRYARMHPRGFRGRAMDGLRGAVGGLFRLRRRVRPLALDDR